MIIVEQRALTDSAANMQTGFLASSVHMEAASMQASSFSSSSHSAAAQCSFKSMSATSMSAMMAESVVTMSSSSQMMGMSAHSHAEASSVQGALTTGVKRGEMHQKWAFKADSPEPQPGVKVKALFEDPVPASVVKLSRDLMLETKSRTHRASSLHRKNIPYSDRLLF